MIATRGIAIVLALALSPGRSVAQPAPPSPARPGQATEPPAPEPKPAPEPRPAPAPPADEGRPEEVSGLVESRDPPGAPGRTVARVALFPLRATWFLIWSPVRLALWSYDRFAVQSRIRRIFFSEDGKAGLFPTVSYTSGFGLSGGLRFVLRDLGAPDARLKLDASYGGQVLQAYKARYRSGRMLGPRAELELGTGFETLPRNRFFGIGNGDTVAPAGVMGIDPLVDATAVDTRYYYSAFFGESALRLAPGGNLGIRLSGGYQRRDFDTDEAKPEDTNTFAVYDPAALTGVEDGLSSVFVDGELAYDTLEQPNFYTSQALPSTGWYLAAQLGAVTGVGKDPSKFVRWGLDLRRYLNLYHHDRILVLRALWRGVSSDALREVPFLDLPTLGGGLLLRGYAQDRFRDRQAGMASAEYQWMVDRNVAAFVFGDAGRVWRNRTDLHDGGLDAVRVGFGGGLQLHSMRNYLGRILVSGSIDGDLFVLLSFDPLFETRRELKRK